MQVSTDARRPVNVFPSTPGPDHTALLTDLRQTLARVVHDVNNPLSIIYGNAQLLAELAKIMELDPDLAKPISDIEEASQQLAGQMAQLSQLKEEMLIALDQQGDTL